MQIAKVIGTVVATKKDERLSGVRLMVIQPCNSKGESTGAPIVAGDAIGSGIGETVIYATSKEGAFCLPDPEACCDAGITAIIDSMYSTQNIRGARWMEADRERYDYSKGNWEYSVHTKA